MLHGHRRSSAGAGAPSPARVSTSTMPKKKRANKNSARIENASRRPEHGPWSDLEQAFFAAAPPDAPAPAIAPECFDDLQPSMTSRPALPPGLERLLRLANRVVSTLSAPRL